MNVNATISSVYRIIEDKSRKFCLNHGDSSRSLSLDVSNGGGLLSSRLSTRGGSTVGKRLVGREEENLLDVGLREHEVGVSS